MQALVKKFLADVSGATAVEYGLIACGIAGAIVGAVQALGSSVEGTYVKVDAAIK
jgi:pilus assembly protein Flp/PilA